MNADFLVLKIHDEIASLDELKDGETRPLGVHAEVRMLIEQALPSVSWRDDAVGIWCSGEVFSVEIGLPPDGEPIHSLTLKVRLHPALGPGGWLPAEDEELENFLLGLCDPNGWTLFELPSGRLFTFRDEIEDDEAEIKWSEAGPVN